MIQNHVTSKELSQSLVDAGIVLDTCFYWQGYLHSGQKVELVTKENLDNDYEHIPAPMSSELGEVLKNFNIDYWYSYPDWRLKLSISTTSDVRDENEANARAKMLLYLKEHDLLPVYTRTMTDRKYTKEFYCKNCGKSFKKDFPFGQVAEKGSCPYCGVSDHQLREPDWRAK